MSEPDTTKIWITSKIRMVSERRLRRQGFASHLAISWISFWLILFSIWFTINGSSKLGNVISIALSLFVFSLSLLFYGMKFDEQADRFRACYLALQKIINSNKSNQEKLDEYHAVLDFFPNHSDRDWETLVYESKWEKREISNAQGPVEFGRFKLLGIGIRRLLVKFLGASVIAVPIILAWLVTTQK